MGPRGDRAEPRRCAASTLHEDLVVVPDATDLFEEPGTLEQAAAAARDWFVRYLPASAATTSSSST